ncbi:37819_t:CDS:2 [Gigaspora margarita]|uniref:37819_t:CDS:1 n=1 Tax=Gigaspora margarita TaxID=4874 RepID=A0ABN7UJZ4_GIGMA|nr:37819_t:CDS:2 [Gigaspora margarita]
MSDMNIERTSINLPEEAIVKYNDNNLIFTSQYNTEGTYINLPEEAIIEYNNISLAFVSKYSIRTCTNLFEEAMVEYNHISPSIISHYNINGTCINLSEEGIVEYKNANLIFVSNENAHFSLSDEGSNILTPVPIFYSINSKVAYTNSPQETMDKNNENNLGSLFDKANYKNVDIDTYNKNINIEFVNLIEAYLSNIHERKKEYQAQQAIDFENNNNDDNSNKENTSISIKLKNPLKVFTKGRPKLSAHCNDNIVNQQKAKDLTHNKQRRDYYCSYYKNKGHNVATCPEKDKDI